MSEAAGVSNLSGEGEEGEHQVDRFWDPRSRTSFRFDHLSLVRILSPSIVIAVLTTCLATQETSDPEQVEPDPVSEPFRYAN